MSIRIYVEGGGETSRQKATLRRGFVAFFQKAGLCPTVIPCGSRNDAYADYCQAVHDFPEDAILLLVDSEDRPSEDCTRWQYLQQRDGWRRPGSVTDENCHLMVQVMETWLVADADALARYYGGEFDANMLPRRSNLEEEPKAQVFRKLNHAVRATPKKGYRKIDDGAGLLASIDPAKVRGRAPHCEMLFARLERLQGEPR